MITLVAHSSSLYPGGPHTKDDSPHHHSGHMGQVVGQGDGQVPDSLPHIAKNANKRNVQES